MLKGLFTLTAVLVFPAIALLVACSSDETPSSIGQGVKEQVKTDTKPTTPPPASNTTPAPKPATTTASTDAGSASKGEAGNGGGAGGPGLDPNDCATQEGPACFQCCVNNQGGENNDIANCLANCAQ